VTPIPAATVAAAVAAAVLVVVATSFSMVVAEKDKDRRTREACGKMTNKVDQTSLHKENTYIDIFIHIVSTTEI